MLLSVMSVHVSGSVSPPFTLSEKSTKSLAEENLAECRPKTSWQEKHWRIGCFTQQISYTCIAKIKIVDR